jgi:outer membrane biosynthesis protein TonB
VKLPEMRTGLIISALAHAALLLWGLISFSARPLEAAPTEALPVDIVSTKQFSELTKGVKNAPKEAEPKPLVEKIGDPKPVEDSSAKVDEKRKIKAAKAEAPPPLPVPEPKPVEKPEKKPPPKVDPIAETLKKEEARRKAEEKAKAKTAPRKPVPQQPSFDPNQIAAMLDKRNPQRLAATGDALVPMPGLGVRDGSAARISQSELDAMRARLMQLWNPPAGVQNPEDLIVKVRIQLGRDGRLAGPPMVLTAGRGMLFETARDNAIRALYRGQPFDMLSAATYDAWKEIEITFDPRDMYRG